jgi:hypothetical protein
VILERPGIPRILHRIVPARLDDEEERRWKAFSALHQGWDLKTWRDPLDPSMFALGDLFPLCRSGAQLADLVRLEVLWRYGGVYVDADCDPIRTFEPLRRYRAFIGTEDGRVLTNAVMGSVPQHPAIALAMELIRSEERLTLDAPPNESTGPHLVTLAMAGRSDVMVLPRVVFYPYNWNERAVPVSAATHPFTVVAHRWQGSWVDMTATSKSQPKPRCRQALSEARAAVRKRSAELVRRWDRLIEVARGGPRPETAPWGSDITNATRALLRLGDHLVEVGSEVAGHEPELARAIGPLGKYTSVPFGKDGDIRAWQSELVEALDPNVPVRALVVSGPQLLDAALEATLEAAPRQTVEYVVGRIDRSSFDVGTHRALNRLRMLRASGACDVLRPWPDGTLSQVPDQHLLLRTDLPGTFVVRLRRAGEPLTPDPTRIKRK